MKGKDDFINRSTISVVIAVTIELASKLRPDHQLAYTPHDKAFPDDIISSKASIPKRNQCHRYERTSFFLSID